MHTAYFLLMDETFKGVHVRRLQETSILKFTPQSSNPLSQSQAIASCGEKDMGVKCDILNPCCVHLAKLPRTTSENTVEVILALSLYKHVSDRRVCHFAHQVSIPASHTP